MVSHGEKENTIHGCVSVGFLCVFVRKKKGHLETGIIEKEIELLIDFSPSFLAGNPIENKKGFSVSL